MLIAPIFHNNYLTQQRSDSRTKKGESSGSLNGAKGEGETSSGTYNIFRSAFNRGTELLKSTFLVKPIAAAEISIPVNNTPLTINDSSASSSPAAIDSPNEDCSSPDSIKTELMLFKPISREPKTSSAANAKIIRVPSIRSSSSTSTLHSPCSSPFFIPITPNRQSAFSFLIQFNESPLLQPLPSPKTNKRKLTKTSSPEKKSVGTSSFKRQKKMVTARIEEDIAPVTKRQTRKNAAERAKVTNKEEEKTDSVRETRSRKRNSDHQTENTNKAEEIKVFKSPQKPAKCRNATKGSLDVAIDKSSTDNSERRITRSMRT